MIHTEENYAVMSQDAMICHKLNRFLLITEEKARKTMRPGETAFLIRGRRLRGAINELEDGSLTLPMGDEQLIGQCGILHKLTDKAFIMASLELPSDDPLLYIPDNIERVPLKYMYEKVLEEHVRRGSMPRTFYAERCTRIRFIGTDMTLYEELPDNGFDYVRIPIQLLGDIHEIDKIPEYPKGWATRVAKNRAMFWSVMEEPALKELALKELALDNGWHDKNTKPTKKQMDVNNCRFWGWDGKESYLVIWDMHDGIFRKSVDRGGITRHEEDKDLKKWTSLPKPPEE